MGTRLYRDAGFAAPIELAVRAARSIETTEDGQMTGNGQRRGPASMARRPSPLSNFRKCSWKRGAFECCMGRQRNRLHGVDLIQFQH
jgi:hypothetical protein